MKNTLKTYVVHYLYGLAASSFNAGITAMIAFLGLAGSAAAGVSVQAMNLRQLVDTFLSAVVVHGLIYFQKNPIPESLPESESINT